MSPESDLNDFGFTNWEKKALLLLGRAIMPKGDKLPAFGKEAIQRLERIFNDMDPIERGAVRSLLWAFDYGALVPYRRPMRMLDEKRALEYAYSWTKANVAKRLSFRLVTTLMKMAYYADPNIYAALGLEFEKPPAIDEPARWISQILPGNEIDEDMELEAEVIVIGTGAGGAAVAAELAEKGDAVLLIEEGDLHRRSEFNGRPLEMQKAMYRNNAITATVGNQTILLPLGKAVGGTTIVNSGTCFRAPDSTLSRWRRENGLTEYTSENMAPYFKRVENIYDVEEAQEKPLGPMGKIIARGAEKLGWSHGPLMRNAPDCDGQGVCVFGCPTDAKKSTNLTYVPDALKRGTYMLTGTAAEKLIVKNGELQGVLARSRATGKVVTAKAPIVVLACGAIHTPLFLMDNGIGGSSGQLGRNLSIHPASGCCALMDEPTELDRSIPQGYMVDEFHHEGIMMEGAAIPLELFTTFSRDIGAPLQRFMERFDKTAIFGFMVEDTSRGVVKKGPKERPLIWYYLNRHDLRLVIRGQQLLAELFLAAGAKRVFAPVEGWNPMATKAEIRANLKKTVHAWDVDLSAYHPLGTCQMGDDPKKFVTSPDGEVFDLPNLFICDGSAIPPALGVNPQITISAVATRNAEVIHQRIHTLSNTR